MDLGEREGEKAKGVSESCRSIPRSEVVWHKVLCEPTRTFCGRSKHDEVVILRLTVFLQLDFVVFWRFKRKLETAFCDQHHIAR